MGRFAEVAKSLAAEIAVNGKTEAGNEKNIITLTILEMADMVESGGNPTSVPRFPGERVQDFLRRVYYEERPDLRDMFDEPTNLREVIEDDLYNKQPVVGFTEYQKTIFAAFKFVEATIVTFDLKPTPETVN